MSAAVVSYYQPVQRDGTKYGILPPTNDRVVQPIKSVIQLLFKRLNPRERLRNKF